MTRFHEQGALLESKGSGGVFPIRIITEGEGSSGFYSRELLEKYRHVFANRPMYINHPTDPNKPWERDLAKIAARTGPNVEYRVQDGVAGLYTEAKVRQEYVELIEEFGDLFGVSIYIGGEGKKKTDSGKLIVESFDESDPYSSVDFVVAAGRGGRVERVLESLRQFEDSPEGENGPASADADKKERENKMDELKALIESLSKSVNDKFVALEAKVDSLVTLSESASAALQGTEDAFKIADEVSEAVVEAKLPKQGRARVIEAVKAGQSVADAVKAESEYVKAIAESFTAPEKQDGPQGRVVEGGGDGFSLTKIAEAK